MNLRQKKELAAKTFNVGKDRIVFVDARKDDIKEAIAKEDMRQLRQDGAIKIKDPKGRRKVRKAKRRTTGNVKKKVKRRKRDYVMLTRKLRKYLKELEKHGTITKEDKKELRKKIRDKDFRSKAQLKDYIQRNK